MDQIKIAKLLSIILGPLWLPALLFVLIFKTGISLNNIKILLPSIFVLQILLPAIYIYYITKSKKVNAWDLPKRHERYSLITINMIFTMISLFLVHLYGNTLLWNLSILLLISLTIITVTTFFFKISFHMSINVVGSILINFLFDWKLPFLYLSIPLIFWARLKLKRHNIYELLIAALFGGLITFGSLFIFGYIKI
ncbi:MAG: hypothetical protein M1426_06215 [Patescibacteria group bacterium]|nr:hypothetical protein [Patescibacteria group bacterium]